MISGARIDTESVPMSFARVLGSPYLRTAALRCIASIFRHFFFAQYRAAFLPGRIPVSRADHPLDGKIPFWPVKVTIYLDFVAFWIRCLGFLLRNYGRRALEPSLVFIRTMGQVYETAAEVYTKHLSTTDRPFYIAHPRFLPIHGLDPHLMCVPSLHVMVVIRTYTFFRQTLQAFAGKDAAGKSEELYRGALAITEAVLYIKQHSVNCIPAAMYAMTKFEPGLFPSGEAERFAAELFTGETEPGKGDAEEIRRHILSLYRRFIAEGEAARDWTKPLLDFLKELPPK
ncbi:MAG: hypothetical protein FWC64_12515 [Treponema sp.]|nr:hypothetical protein [Treponema sp.]